MDRYGISIGKTPPSACKKLKKIEKHSLGRKKLKNRSGIATDLSDLRESIIAGLMRTAEGRNRLASSMTQPLRRRMYASIARRMFFIDPLPPNTSPVYDVELESYFIDDEGQQVVSSPGSRRGRIQVPLFEIASNFEIPLVQIQQRRFDLIDRGQEHLIQSIREIEEFSVLSIMERASSNNIINASLTIKNLSQIFNSIEEHDLRVANLLMSSQSYNDLRNMSMVFFDRASDNMLNNVGIMGTLFGAQINVSQVISDGQIYALAEPQFVGVIPVRSDLTIYNADDPRRRAVGFSAVEEIGMACTNPRGIVRLNFSSNEEPQKQIQDKESKTKIRRMDRYTLLKAHRD